MATTTSSSPLEKATSGARSLSASAGITGGYTCDSLPMKIVMALMLGLGIYNALEVFVIIFVTLSTSANVAAPAKVAYVFATGRSRTSQSWRCKVCGALGMI
ncbi:hypothetical protein B0J11DRAFT_586873 [Dendryphion nanum]|uniref:Uncharacterized protein n=1 Tax=Dendryphion nanum TaxID=256645 RepID=A0A9P9CX79_9PLEO|nr:hypothetical protein B0J11DRAFT_586873 [Dendryphion nanum]